jgi:hypothetical protein
MPHPLLPHTSFLAGCGARLNYFTQLLYSTTLLNYFTQLLYLNYFTSTTSSMPS